MDEGERTTAAYNHNDDTHAWVVLPFRLVNCKLIDILGMSLGQIGEFLLQVEGDNDAAIGCDAGEGG